LPVKKGILRCWDLSTKRLGLLILKKPGQEKAARNNAYFRASGRCPGVRMKQVCFRSRGGFVLTRLYIPGAVEAHFRDND
jgi:hypothetical protein